MKKKIALIIPIVIIITIIVSLFSFSEEIENYSNDDGDTKWISSGPFAIDREEYLIGHKIFLIAAELNPNEKGVIKIVKMDEYENWSERVTNAGSGKIVKSYPFNAKSNSEFNIYFSPNLSHISKICSVEDLIGNYEVVFDGTNYQNIKFKILNQYLPGTENRFDPIC